MKKECLILVQKGVTNDSEEGKRNYFAIFFIFLQEDLTEMEGHLLTCKFQEKILLSLEGVAN